MNFNSAKDHSLSLSQSFAQLMALSFYIGDPEGSVGDTDRVNGEDPVKQGRDVKTESIIC